jgi:hypothetical protein
VSGEAIAKALWNNLGDLYQSNSLVNKFFLWNKLYNLRIKDGDLVSKHLNSFNTVVSQLLSVDINISNEDKCISLLLSLPNSWDSMVVAIGSDTTTLFFDDLVSPLLSEEMRHTTRKSKAQMPYFQEEYPRKEIDLSTQVGDLNIQKNL